ncbi:MAG TPA: hypothetical protein VGG20_03140 [Thermoanaerobaculia bacterium]
MAGAGPGPGGPRAGPAEAPAVDDGLMGSGEDPTQPVRMTAAPEEGFQQQVVLMVVQAARQVSVQPRVSPPRTIAASRSSSRRRVSRLRTSFLRLAESFFMTVGSPWDSLQRHAGGSPRSPSGRPGRGSFLSVPLRVASVHRREPAKPSVSRTSR